MGLYLKSYNGKPDPVDPIKVIQGHVDDQYLTVKQSRDIIVEKFLMREHVVHDNHGNVYLVYDARLPDGDTYTHALRLKPSEVAAGGGYNPEGHELMLTDANLAQGRYSAIQAFSKVAINTAKPKEEKTIIKGNFDA